MTIYSHSRLEAFKSCPLKYKFNYIDKIKREEEGIEAFLGSRFHEVTGKYRGQVLKYNIFDPSLFFSPEY